MNKKIILSINVPIHPNMDEEKFISLFKNISKTFNKDVFDLNVIQPISDEDIEKGSDNPDIQLGMKTMRDLIFK